MKTNPGYFAIALLVLVSSGTAVADKPLIPFVLSDDGAWCWFQDERALVRGSTIWVASVASGSMDGKRQGDTDLVEYDLKSGQLTQSELHDQLEADDHAAPALWLRPDGRLLAVYSKHGSENCYYSRLTRLPGNFSDWLPESRFIPSDGSRITYSNLHFLSAENGRRGRLYNFFRGLDASFKPSYAFSDDWGATWQAGNIVIDVPLAFRHRPYVKYASNGVDTIHLVYTDGHPRDFDNSVYHIFCRAGRLCRSDGAVVAGLEKGLRNPCEGTRIFAGDERNVAWVSDLHLSSDGRPYLVYSVQKNSGGLKSGDEKAGQDHRYRYAWWDGANWQDREIGFGGTRLYPGEDDYTGNICLDPDQLDTVFFATNSDPQNGRLLVSAADGQRHFEIFRGRTTSGGQAWDFASITNNSSIDNLRPIVPKRNSNQTALLWFRGTYRTYRDYDTQIVGLALDDSQ